MSTIYDVAREAGVSIGTVSYVLNGRGRISAETAARVRAAVEKLNYQPRAAARALARGRTYTIALVAPLGIYGYQMSLLSVISAIGQTLADTDYRLFIHPTLDQTHAWAELDADVRGRQMDGIILMHVQMQDPRVELLRRSRMPFVLIGRCEDNRGLYYVDTDIEACARLAVEYLHSLGHDAIAMVGERGEAGITARLVAGYQEGLAAQGLKFRPDWCVHIASGPAAATEAAVALLSSQPRPTAVFALSDAIVLGTINAARILGLSVPRELAIIGFADSPLYPFLHPPCSAVFAGTADLGRVAAEMILSRLHGDEPEPSGVLIPPRLVIRASTQELMPNGS